MAMRLARVKKFHVFGRVLFAILLAMLLAMLAGCQAPTDPQRTAAVEPPQEILVASYPDLVSASLGLEGLSAPRPTPSDSNNPSTPTPEQLRAITIHTHFNALSAIQTNDGLGEFVQTGLPVVPGTEIMTWRPVADGAHRARALLQIPDGFANKASGDKACLVVAPASGSRGVYGAAPLAAPWALAKGCAVVYSDKGAGSDYFDFQTQTGVALDGQRVGLDAGQALGFVPANPSVDGSLVATAHAHSRINVEAHWGEITLDAVDWAIEQLADYGIAARTDLLIIATGLSNGGQAVLRALEADQDGLLDAVVAIMPNITPANTTANTPALYEYAAMAALYQPCALGDQAFAANLPFANPLLIGFGPIRCQSLFEAGLLEEASPALAKQKLMELGFDDDAFAFSAANVALDIWRTVLVHYASAYLKTPADSMPCGFGLDAMDASEEQKALWWATGSGTPPGDGIVLKDTMATKRPADPHFPGLMCLADLIEDPALIASMEQTKAKAQWPNQVPVLIVHGQHDGLIPAVFSSRAYVEQAIDNGMALDYQEIPGAQHFDAFLNAVPNDERWRPILPHGWEALDKAWDRLQAAPKP